MLLFWIIVFIISLAALVKGSSWLLEKSEKIGLALGLSPFIVGVIIVGIGTSFPELVSSLAAVFKGATEIVPANAIGSNIANILLIIGLSSIIARKLVVTKNLIDVDLPLLAISTSLFLIIIWDSQITFYESLILIMAYTIYLLYSFLHDEHKKESTETKTEKTKVTIKDYTFLAFGLLGLILGAKYLIDSVINLSQILSIGTGVISLVAVAFGTSLPELMVSAKAALEKKSEIALGNIFGSNAFNILMVTGIPGLFKTLRPDYETMVIALPILIIATFLFIISGISKRIHIWEGSMYLLIYVFFIGKLFNLI